jgi:hypothetical protein
MLKEAGVARYTGFRMLLQSKPSFSDNELSQSDFYNAIQDVYLSESSHIEQTDLDTIFRYYGNTSSERVNIDEFFTDLDTALIGKRLEIV